MLSDDELLDRDASDSIFAKETPREDSPRTFTCHLINRFSISSKGGTETVINNTQSKNIMVIIRSTLSNRTLRIYYTEFNVSICSNRTFKVLKLENSFYMH